LIQHGIKASLDESAAVVCDDRNRNEVAKGHLFEPGLPGIRFANPLRHSFHALLRTDQILTGEPHDPTIEL
jgi:hypothetical protein